MYRKILVALENSRADETLLPHIGELAKLHGSELLLVHVADGFVARNYEQLKLAESQEMKDEDRKSTRLNSSHSSISYAVFCLKKKTAVDILGIGNPHMV